MAVTVILTVIRAVLAILVGVLMWEEYNYAIALLAAVALTYLGDIADKETK